MGESMVTGRIDADKKARVGRILQQEGFNASQAINLMYDHIDQAGNCQFLGGSPSPAASEKAWLRATRFVDSLLPTSKTNEEASELPERFATKEDRFLVNSKLMIATDVFESFFLDKGKLHDDARCLLIAGRVGALALWTISETFTRMYTLIAEKFDADIAAEKLRGLRTFIDVQPIGNSEVDRLLCLKPKHFGQSALIEAALSLHAEDIISNDCDELEQPYIDVLSCRDILQQTTNPTY